MLGKTLLSKNQTATTNMSAARTNITIVDAIPLIPRI
jgi:hypothetical protein